MANASPLLDLLNCLDRRAYDFVSPTPATHQRLTAKRPRARPGDLRDIFGWSLPFDSLDAEVVQIMEAAGVLASSAGGERRSTVRVSRVHGRLFLHSAFPTDDEDSVFLGPDSYRFADFILANLTSPVERVADLGAGAGVGALTTAGAAPSANVILTDVNASALELARVNATHAAVAAQFLLADGLQGAPEDLDLVLANPPFMADSEGRAYRDGGGAHGAEISIRWAREALAHLRPGGRLLLYSGSAIIDGQDRLKEALERLEGAHTHYREIDPDIFGEEITRPGYEDVERIAAVGAVITRL